jgi:DHA2 family methylenomycin A resistance protein-like MFS transporter
MTQQSVSEQVGSGHTPRTPGRWVALIVAAVASFMVFLDATIVNLALPTLGRRLGGGRADVEWVMNGYTLTFAAVMLGAGALSDKVGARRVFVTGLIVFGAASASAASPATCPN